MKKNVAVFVATVGPQGEVLCVREWVREESIQFCAADSILPSDRA